MVQFMLLIVLVNLLLTQSASQLSQHSTAKGFWGITSTYLYNSVDSSFGWTLYKNIDGTDGYIAPSRVTRYTSYPPYSPTAPLNPLSPSDPNYLTTPNSNPDNPNRAYYEYQVHSGVHSCANEDINGNNFLDAGEDVNGNGQLDPINPATVLDMAGINLTPIKHS